MGERDHVTKMSIGEMCCEMLEHLHSASDVVVKVAERMARTEQVAGPDTAGVQALVQIHRAFLQADRHIAALAVLATEREEAACFVEESLGRPRRGERAW